MQDGRINVLHIVGNARLGGVASCLMNYFRRTDTRKFRFDFVTYAPSEFDGAVHEVDASAKVYHISPFQKNFLKGIFGMEKICKNNDYKVVHSHLTTLSAFCLSAAAHAKVPVRICHAHSTFNRHSDHYLAKKLLRPFAADNATHIMACSKHAAENIFGKNAGKAIILPDAIELDKFRSDENMYAAARKKLGLRGKAVLFVGRFVFQKNIPLLVHAFAKAAQKEDVTLVLIGDGEERHSIISLINELNINDKVRLIAPSDPSEWYKAADVFCLPSRYEGLGMAAIEAQAAGLKCLLSQNVPKETDVTGSCLFLPDDEDAWAQAMLEPAPHDYACRKKLAAAHYDIEREAHRLTDFYIEALAEAQE